MINNKNIFNKILVPQKNVIRTKSDAEKRELRRKLCKEFSMPELPLASASILALITFTMNNIEMFQINCGGGGSAFFFPL
jgi:hypothetical protein